MLLHCNVIFSLVSLTVSEKLSSAEAKFDQVLSSLEGTIISTQSQLNQTNNKVQRTNIGLEDAKSEIAQSRQGELIDNSLLKSRL